jgi:IS5 family transposase
MNTWPDGAMTPFRSEKNTTRIDGFDGARTWCGHGVFNHNLIKIAALMD